MDKSFHQGNRQKFYDSLENGTIALFFSGHAFRKTADEFFPFYANRNFVYLTGIEKENFVLMAEKQNDQVHELLFILPPDAHAERWTGRRMKADEVLERSCITAMDSAIVPPDSLSPSRAKTPEMAQPDGLRNSPSRSMFPSSFQI